MTRSAAVVGAARTMVGSVAVSLDVLNSPPPATVTLGVVVCVVSVVPTFTVNVIGGYEVESCSTSLRVQTAVCPLPEHVQPEPNAEEYVSLTGDVGKVTVALTTPSFMMPVLVRVVVLLLLPAASVQV